MKKSSNFFNFLLTTAIKSFYLAHYRVVLQALEPLELPPSKGSALRGGFGYVFKKLVCFQSKLCDKNCQLANQCPYGYIFETSPPPNSTVLRTLSHIPRPFIITPPLDLRTHIPANEQLTFHLTLVGRAINYLPYFIMVFRHLGQVGLGHKQGKYSLISIENISPYTSKTYPIYSASTDLIEANERKIEGHEILSYAATLASNQIKLNFLMPTRLKHKGKLVKEGPSFQALIQALLGRTSSLSYFHCEQLFEVDFKKLIAQASNIAITQNKTQWKDWSRHSGRQKQRIQMGGLMGTISYEGNLTNYLPLLALGELIHIGKGTVFGNGHYHIVN